MPDDTQPKTAPPGSPALAGSATRGKVLCPRCGHVLADKGNLPVCFGRCQNCDTLLDADDEGGYRVWPNSSLTEGGPVSADCNSKPNPPFGAANS